MLNSKLKYHVKNLLEIGVLLLIGFLLFVGIAFLIQTEERRIESNIQDKVQAQDFFKSCIEIGARNCFVLRVDNITWEKNKYGSEDGTIHGTIYIYSLNETVNKYVLVEKKKYN